MNSSPEKQKRLKALSMALVVAMVASIFVVVPIDGEESIGETNDAVSTVIDKWVEVHGDKQGYQCDNTIYSDGNGNVTFNGVNITTSPSFDVAPTAIRFYNVTTLTLIGSNSIFLDCQMSGINTYALKFNDTDYTTICGDGSLSITISSKSSRDACVYGIHCSSSVSIKDCKIGIDIKSCDFGSSKENVVAGIRTGHDGEDELFIDNAEVNVTIENQSGVQVYCAGLCPGDIYITDSKITITIGQCTYGPYGIDSFDIKIDNSVLSIVTKGKAFDSNGHNITITNCKSVTVTNSSGQERTLSESEYEYELQNNPIAHIGKRSNELANAFFGIMGVVAVVGIGVACVFISKGN